MVWSTYPGSVSQEIGHGEIPTFGCFYTHPVYAQERRIPYGVSFGSVVAPLISVFVRAGKFEGISNFYSLVVRFLILVRVPIQTQLIHHFGFIKTIVGP